MPQIGQGSVGPDDFVLRLVEEAGLVEILLVVQVETEIQYLKRQGEIDIRIGPLANLSLEPHDGSAGLHGPIPESFLGGKQESWIELCKFP